jgi:hypothetical protein
MKLASLALAATVAASALLPMAASAQALDATTGRQAVVELANDVRHAQAFSGPVFVTHGPNGADSCEPIDPAVQQQAVNELTGLDQRAADLAYRTSGTVHAQAMTIVRTIETRQWNLLHPIVADNCYVAPGAPQPAGPAQTPQSPYLDTDTSWTGSAGWR